MDVCHEVSPFITYGPYYCVILGWTFKVHCHEIFQLSILSSLLIHKQNGIDKLLQIRIVTQRCPEYFGLTEFIEYVWSMSNVHVSILLRPSNMKMLSNLQQKFWQRCPGPPPSWLCAVLDSVQLDSALSRTVPGFTYSFSLFLNVFNCLMKNKPPTYIYSRIQIRIWVLLFDSAR